MSAEMGCGFAGGLMSTGSPTLASSIENLIVPPVRPPTFDCWSFGTEMLTVVASRRRVWSLLAT